MAIEVLGLGLDYADRYKRAHRPGHGPGRAAGGRPLLRAVASAAWWSARSRESGAAALAPRSLVDARRDRLRRRPSRSARGSGAKRCGSARSRDQSEAFDDEWRVRVGDSVTVITPFHRLVLAARHAAFKNERLKTEERDRLLHGQQDRLVIWRSFAVRARTSPGFYAAARPGGSRDRAAFVQNERTARRTAAGTWRAASTGSRPRT